MLLGEAAWLGDADFWRRARQGLADELRPRDGCQLIDHYRDEWEALGEAADKSDADAFLNRVPFF
jgi:hypothetical protein